jgi:glycosyltransferase involved in cell wall biosynthesis
MMNRPLISVVMAVHNESQYIQQAIESILAQSFQQFEFIIIDDGSTDDTAAVIDGIKDNRIKLIKTAKTNLGTALNSGIKETRSEFIARIDGDDFCEIDRFELQFQWMSTHPEYGLLGSNGNYVDEEGLILAPTDFPLENQHLQNILLNGISNPFLHGSVILRKKALSECGLYRGEFRYSQDLDLWLRLAEVSKIANLGERLYFHRIRPGKTGASKWDDQRDYSNLARICAETRRRGESEPELSLLQDLKKTRKFPNNLDLEPESFYHLSIANILLDSDRPQHARKHLNLVKNNGKFNFNLAFLNILSFMPKSLRHLLLEKIRSGYRKILRTSLQ